MALNLGALSPVCTYCWGGAIVLGIGFSAEAGVADESGIAAGAGISAEAGVTAEAGKADNAEMTETSMADMTAGSEFR